MMHRTRWPGAILGLLLALTLAPATARSDAARVSALQALQWQNRLVLIFAADPKQAELVEQTALLDTATAQLVERDLLWIRVVGDQVQLDPRFPTGGTSMSSLQLRDYFDVARPRFTVLLLGKDGQIKLRTPEVLQIDALLGLIDSMPMRRQERREPKV
jgi:hypothetical protein